MFRDLRERVTPTRRVLAWVLLAAIVACGGWYLPRLSQHPFVLLTAKALFWSAVSYASVRLLTFLLLDPLLRQRKNATPGFARDLLVVTLYLLAGGGILHQVLNVDLGSLLGTGAVVAAVVGLSLQTTLGNLFAGIAMHLDATFQEGDWIEVTGTLRPGGGRDTYVGEVISMTWRTVQLRTENGDLDVFPNNVISQAVVTNLYVPSGLHRRTTKVVVEPHPQLHHAVAILTQALAGIPHLSSHRPEIVVAGLDLGGAVLEARFWTLGFRHGRAATYQANRLLATVLPREGFSLLGPHGPTTPHPQQEEPTDMVLDTLATLLRLRSGWGRDLRPLLRLRVLAPGEAIIREGDPGESLFAVLEGSLQVVHVEEREEPFHGLFWAKMGDLSRGDWFGEQSLLTGSPRSATIVASTEARLLEVPKLALEKALAQEPDLLERLVDLMARRQESAAPTEARKPREHWKDLIKNWFRLGQ
jgi:small-conductance mechanosensitive channel